jgi:predicted SprT family Zn-dependent metalloprotease
MEEREAQKIINRMARKYGVPSIKVRKAKIEGGVAFFDGEKWEIYFSEKADRKVLAHEFCHYVIKLAMASDAAEEKVADTFAKGEWE